MLLTSQRIQFSRDGQLLACADANGVVLVRVAGLSTPTRIVQPGVVAIAVFPGQVWTLDEQRTHLQRYASDGRTLAAPEPLAIAPCSQWMTSTTGAPAVLMEGAGRRLYVAEAETLFEKQVPAAGVAFPLDGRRHVFCSRDHQVLLGGNTTFRLAAGIVPLGGASVLDARYVLLIVGDPRGERGAILVDTAAGRTKQQLELAHTERSESRIAPQRGMLVVHTSDRRFAIVDLLPGRLHALVEAPVDVDDFAVDPAAKTIAIRSGATIHVYALGQLTPTAHPQLELALDTERLPVEPANVCPSVTADDSIGAIPIRIPLASPASPDAEPPEPDEHRLPIAVGSISSELTSPDATSRAANPTSWPPPAAKLAPQSVSTLRLSPLRDDGSAPRASGAEPPLPPSDTTISHTGTSSHAIMAPERERRDADAQAAPTRSMRHPVDERVVELFKLRGFGPPPKRLDISRHDAMRMLIGELRWVELRTLLAIAHGWDTGRIAYANESRLPQELEASAILAGSAAGGHARDHVETARQALDEHELALANDPSRHTETTPLGALEADFELSPLATKILLVVAAPTLRGEVRRLYAILANDPSRAPVDELLVEQILADSPEARSDIAYELRPDGPLCRYGLVHVDRARPRPHAPLVVDPVVVARLRAEPIEFGPGAAITVRGADRALHELLVPSELVLDAMRYLSQAPSATHHVRIAARGPVGSGRRTLLAAIVHKAGRELGIIDLRRLPRAADELAHALRTELRRALLCRLVPCLVSLEDVAKGSDDPLRLVIQDTLRSHPGPAAVHLAPREKVPLDPGYLLLDLKPPNETQRLEVWRESLARHRLAVDDPQLLAARYRVGPGIIHRVTRAVAEARTAQGRLACDAVADLEKLMRQTREVSFGDQARRVERLGTWESLVLPEDTTYSLRELIGRARHHRTVFEQWGFDHVVSTARGITALFEGPPGTGKTLVAGVIARELGRDLYQIDLSKVMSKWIGETEKNLGAIFDAAEDGQVILLFDEADSLFAKRSEVRSSNDRFANLEVNYLLQRLDAFEGFAILTTNFGTSIDPAFKRRLSFRLTFPFPDPDMRADLWRVHLPPRLPIAGHLDLHALAHKYELSGGYIRNACLRAAFLAAEDGGYLTQAHLVRAVELEYAEVGKLSRSGRME